MISIIVPVYNVEAYLEVCINSILKQSYSDFELIIVNDGSVDKSGEICEKYAQKDCRIKYIEKENEGLSSARNIGIRIATGDYIAFIDSDDYVHKEYLEVLVDNLEKYQADISICSFKVIHNNCVDALISGKINVKILTNYEALHKMFEEECIGYIVAWAKLYKKELFDGITYPIGKIHEDEFVTYRLLAKANKIVYLKEGLYYYRVRDNSIMTSKLSEKSLVRLDAYCEQMKFFKENDYDDLFSLAAQRYIEKSADYYINLENCDPKIKNQLKNTCRKLFERYHELFEYHTLRQQITIFLFVKNPSACVQFSKIIEFGSKVKRFLKNGGLEVVFKIDFKKRFSD